MIYYSNTDPKIPHMVFIGRWSPFHRGHIAIIEKKRQQHSRIPVLIMVRDRKKEKYPTILRAEIIKLWMKKNKIKGTIMIIPDIEGIYWGRKVGYKTEMVEVDQKIKVISATNIRNGIKNGEKSWKKLIALKDASYLLTSQTAKIAQNGLVVWFTGCPSAGKTTISERLKQKIKKTYPHLKTQILDGDVIRNTPMAQAVGFSVKDRAEHILRMGQLAKILADNGILVIASFVSPDRKIRNQVKKKIGKNRFLEVYVKADLKTRIKRDKKGLYTRAKKGEIKNLTGYNAPYDEPKNPTLVCNTNVEKVKESADKIFRKIFENE